MHFACPIRRDHDDRRLRRANRSELGDGDLEIGQQFEQIAFELLVRAVDLVDQQDRRLAFRLLDGAKQGPLDEEGIREEFPLGCPRIQRVRPLEQPNLENLPRVVPLVDGVADVEAFVTLQPNQLGIERRGEHLGHFRLPDAGLTFEEERPLQAQREIRGDGESAAGDVLPPGHGLLQGVYGGGDVESH